MHEKSLIIRTSFGPSVFPYEKAFTDQWTSRESVDVFAEKLVGLIDSDVVGVIHVGGPRRSVHEYALSLGGDKEVKPLSIREMNFKVPVDTSLNTLRYQRIEEVERSGFDRNRFEKKVA
jgi:dTDP-4-dehydrorhamnose reductase